MNIPVLGKQLLQALMDAGFTFFIPYLCYHYSGGVWGMQGTGYVSDVWVFGTTVYTCLIISMFLRVGMLTCSWTWPSLVCLAGSILLYISFLLGYEVSTPSHRSIRYQIRGAYLYASVCAFTSRRIVRLSLLQ